MRLLSSYRQPVGPGRRFRASLVEGIAGVGVYGEVRRLSVSTLHFGLGGGDQIGPSEASSSTRPGCWHRSGLTVYSLEDACNLLIPSDGPAGIFMLPGEAIASSFTAAPGFQRPESRPSVRMVQR